MWTKFGLILQKILKCGRPGGGGVFSDFGHPRTRGGGGVKKGQIFADVLYGWPQNVYPLSAVTCSTLNCDTVVTFHLMYEFI